MPFAAFFLVSSLFLILVTTPGSLAADAHFHPWLEGPPSYGPARDGQWPPPAGFGGGPSDPRGGIPQERWYRLERRTGGAPDDRWDLAPRRRGPAPHRRHFDSVQKEDYPGAQNIGYSCSSHVNCEAANQNDGAAKVPKNFRENVDPVFGPGLPGDGSSSEEGSRILRTGNPKEVDAPNPRIVTPKRGRRPPQGAPNQTSTTEKASRNQTSKGPKKPRPSGSKPLGGDIVFPDGYPKKFVPRVAKCAKKSTFCEHIGDEYPTDYISQVLKKEGATFKEFFGWDVISDPNITERINAPEENSLCPYRQEVVFPRAAQNKEDKWLFIVNQDQYVQGVTVEVCLNPESRCILTEGFPLGYTPYCKQKYIERRLVAIGEDGKPHSDSFRLPSCCSCVVKHETAARTGLLRAAAP